MGGEIVLQFSANLTMLFNEVGFLDRFEMASRAGFKGVEFMFPYEFDKDPISEKLDKYGLEVVLHNIPAGNWAGGERGIACLPDRVGEFQSNVGRAIEYAKALKCPRLNCMAGLGPQGVPSEKVRQTFINNLRFAGAALAKENIRLLIEPINTTDMPGFYLNHTQQALEMMLEINHPNIWLQYDIYHMQIMEGNLINTIRSNIGKIGHMQIADNPGRHEPGTGEINFPNVFRSISETGYTGWIGCEYKPLKGTEEGLTWVKPYVRKGGK
jgi:hydroxypyruvate isomerase